MLRNKAIQIYNYKQTIQIIDLKIFYIRQTLIEWDVPPM